MDDDRSEPLAPDASRPEPVPPVPAGPRHRAPTTPEETPPADRPLVPVTIWRLPPRRAPKGPPQALFAGLTPRLAAALVTAYTRPGQLVLDWSADLALAGACGAGGRRYQIIDPGQPNQAAALVILRADTSGSRPHHQLSASAALLQHDARLAVVLTPTATVHEDLTVALLGAAHTAGLHYLEHVIAVIAPEARRRAAHAAQPVPAVPGEQGHIDLLVFVLRHDLDATP